MPLLERPTELSGRRARKAVERFSESGTPETKRGSLPLEQGRGAKLADCPVVNTNIGVSLAVSCRPLATTDVLLSGSGYCALSTDGNPDATGPRGGG